MEKLFGEDYPLEIEELYAAARQLGIEWVRFLDICFDGGDSVDEARELFMEYSSSFESVADQ